MEALAGMRQALRPLAAWLPQGRLSWQWRVRGHRPLPGRGERVGAVRDALPPELLRAVQQECAAVHEYTKAAESASHPVGGFSFHTRWFPAGAQPRCAVEAAVALLRSRLFAEAASSLCGCEWWVQRRPPADVMDFHWDTDSQLLHDSGEVRAPATSSILYLSEVGGPTVVLDQVQVQGLFFGASVRPSQVQLVDLIYPRENQFAWFQGDLLHGVLPAAAARGRAEPRTTLLINWWTEEPPRGPCCAEPPADLYTKLRQSVGGAQIPAALSPPAGELQRVEITQVDLTTERVPCQQVAADIPTHSIDFFIPTEATETADAPEPRGILRILGQQTLRRLELGMQ